MKKLLVTLGLILLIPSAQAGHRSGGNSNSQYLAPLLIGAAAGYVIARQQRQQQYSQPVVVNQQDVEYLQPFPSQPTSYQPRPTRYWERPADYQPQQVPTPPPQQVTPALYQQSSAQLPPPPPQVLATPYADVPIKASGCPTKAHTPIYQEIKEYIPRRNAYVQRMILVGCQ